MFLRSLLACIALTSAPAFAQTTGAIFTSDRSGNVVNGNLYANKRDVYLSGGPGPGAPCSAAGLPDGNYYFQVTDPSGAMLLSTDAIAEREVRVQGGVIVAHVTGSHRTGNGSCGSRTVQLLPFNDTPNAGGEYKVWMTGVGNYDPLGSGFFGFRAKFSKTDNFKVRSGRAIDQTVIRGYKFFDHSEDGVWNPSLDPLELPIAGWRIEIWRGSNLDGITYTDETGRYMFLRNLDNTSWTIVERAPGGFIGDNIPGAIWLAITPRSGTVITNAAAVAGPDFGNLSFEVRPGVGRTKGFWHNNNGRILLEQCDPLWREVLVVRNGTPVCLRRNVSSADPQLSLFLPLQPPVPFATAFDDFADWIVGDPALGHAGFILSTQVAAAILNNDCGFMQFTAYIDRFQNGVLVSFDDMVRGVSGLLCDPGAGLTGPNDPAQALRDRMLACTNEFGSINSTGDLSEAQVVFGPASRPGDFNSPY